MWLAPWATWRRCWPTGAWWCSSRTSSHPTGTAPYANWPPGTTSARRRGSTVMVPLPLAVALLLQAHHPTVGDTVWVTIAVRASGRVVLRPQPWDLGELGQVLGPAELISRGDSVQVRYPVAFWLAGE